MRIYLFRGLAGSIFSKGMDNLAEKLAQAGHTASVHSWIERTKIQAEAIAEFNAGTQKGPFITIGHSLGGNSANFMGINLLAANVPVSYIATIDPTEPKPAPAGVNCDNFRSHDLRAEKVPGAIDHYRPDLNHIQIDKDQAVHARIVKMCGLATGKTMPVTIPETMEATTPMPDGINFDSNALIMQLVNNLVSGENSHNLDPELMKLLSAIASKSEEAKKTTDDELPINFALGKTVGKVLNGKKTGLGIAGLLATFILPTIFPGSEVATTILGALGIGGDAGVAEPSKVLFPSIFGALTGWGVLGKIEKWIKLIRK